MFWPTLRRWWSCLSILMGSNWQQHCWTKGAIQTCKKLLPGASGGVNCLFIEIEATVHLTANCATVAGFLCVLLHPSAMGADSFANTGASFECSWIRSADFCGHDGVDRLFSSLCAKGTPSESLEMGDLFFHLSWRSELAFQSIMHGAVWRRSSIVGRISARHRNMALKGRSSSGKQSRYFAVRTVDPIVEFIFRRCTLHTFRISGFSKLRVSVMTGFECCFKGRLCLRGILFSMAALYAPAVESERHFGSLKPGWENIF